MRFEMVGPRQLFLTALSRLRVSAQGDISPDPSLNIKLPGNVTAGVSTLVTLASNQIPQDFVNNNSSALRVRLYNSVANYPVCDLIEATPQQPQNFNVTIPLDVGPPGAYYALAVDYTETPFLDWTVKNLSASNPGIFATVAAKFSNTFFLSNATSAWISYETTTSQQQDHQQGGLFIYENNASLPCEAYECMRKCAQLYPTPKLDDEHPPTATYHAAYLKCAGDCEGIKLPPNPTATGDPDAPPTNLLTPPTINMTCDATQFNTPCNEHCCTSSQVCLPWGSCVAIEDAIAAESSAIPTVTPIPTGLAITTPFVPVSTSDQTGTATAPSGPMSTSHSATTSSATTSSAGQVRVGTADRPARLALAAATILAGAVAFHLGM